MTAARQLDLFGAARPAAPEPTREQLRDETIARHQKARPESIASAIRAGFALCARNGGFTASEIPDEMRRQGDGCLLANEHDLRWIGGAIVHSNGFRNTGVYVSTGSKGRKQPRWVRA